MQLLEEVGNLHGFTRWVKTTATPSRSTADLKKGLFLSIPALRNKTSGMKRLVVDKGMFVPAPYVPRLQIARKLARDAKKEETPVKVLNFDACDDCTQWNKSNIVYI